MEPKDRNIDLELDSIQFLSLLVSIEKEMHFELMEEDMDIEKFKTFDDFYLLMVKIRSRT